MRFIFALVVITIVAKMVVSRQGLGPAAMDTLLIPAVCDTNEHRKQLSLRFPGEKETRGRLALLLRYEWGIINSPFDHLRKVNQ